jgi:hypothetical protein
MQHGDLKVHILLGLYICMYFIVEFQTLESHEQLNA